jgi:hypothetical protein
VRQQGTAVMGSSSVLNNPTTCYQGSSCLQITQPAPTRTSNSNDIGRYQLAAALPAAVDGTDLWYGWAMKYSPNWDATQIDHTRSYFLGTGGFRYTSTPRNGPGANLGAWENPAAGNVAYWRSGLDLTSSVGNMSTGATWLGPVVTGRWVTFVEHVRWSTRSDGTMEWWRDGVKMGQYDGATFGSKSPPPKAEYRLGIYEGTKVDVDRSIYYDNVRVGTSYAAVDPAH